MIKCDCDIFINKVRNPIPDRHSWWLCSLATGSRISPAVNPNLVHSTSFIQVSIFTVLDTNRCLLSRPIILLFLFIYLFFLAIFVIFSTLNKGFESGVQIQVADKRRIWHSKNAVKRMFSQVLQSAWWGWWGNPFKSRPNTTVCVMMCRF